MTTLTDEQLFNQLSQARTEGKDVDAVLGQSIATDNESPSSSPAAAPAPAPSPSPAPAADDLSGLSQVDLIARLNKAEADTRAAKGRAAAAQREAETLRRLQQAAAPAPAAAPTASKVDALAEQFPEVGSAVVELKESFDKRLEQSTLETRLAALDAAHPDWFETMKSDSFNYWLTQQDEATRKLIDTDSVASYSRVLSKFNGSHQAPSVSPQPNEADRIAAERAERLANSIPVQGKSSTPQSGEPDPENDAIGYFNFVSKRRDQQRAGQ